MNSTFYIQQFNTYILIDSVFNLKNLFGLAKKTKIEKSNSYVSYYARVRYVAEWGEYIDFQSTEYVHIPGRIFLTTFKYR